MDTSAIRLKLLHDLMGEMMTDAGKQRFGSKINREDTEVPPGAPDGGMKEQDPGKSLQEAMKGHMKCEVCDSEPCECDTLGMDDDNDEDNMPMQGKSSASKRLAALAAKKSKGY